MRTLSLVLLALVAGSVASAAESPNAGAAATQSAEAKSPVERLKADPNDVAAFNQYMMESLRRLQTVMDANPKAAERTLGEMKQLFESLKPETEPAKQMLSRAKATIRVYEQQIEVARTPLEAIGNRLKANPDDAQALSMFLAKIQRQIGPLTRSEPDKAEADLKEAQELLAKVRTEAKEEAAKQRYEQADRMFAGLQKMIETARRLAALIGQNAAPLDVETWVNGTALTDADLKGKVVLLDFWAVWCGPCIATFPHLREWHEKYAEKGLVIIGLTNYYGFVWDEKQGRATTPARKTPAPQASGAAPPPTASAEPPEKPTPAQEQEMLVKFAEQHQLHHRFAIQKGKALPEYYAVSGIPHVVVIDREGKIRLIRVGSGEKNAQDIATLLASLLGDGAGAK